MESNTTSNYELLWVDLLKGINVSSWYQVINLLYYKNHGFSNYKNCLKRDYSQIREQVFHDNRVKNYINLDDGNKKKVERILDEMCHLLAIQCNPTRKLKIAGAPFLKCITKVYSSIYVNNHLLSCETGEGFREQYLKISKDMPVIILPTHRSYMDFLFITYIMFINELPLPIVAAGDNFKAMGKILLDYLKATGAFLVRRSAANKKDIEASTYYDILRAYVHSIVTGGENPLEFFMEGTRTRVGHVLRPKTGLLSMVVDLYLEGKVSDVCIMPVSISYQRPIEEQLYVAENSLQTHMKKPKENARNLVSGMKAIMKRQYGKVYVRFIQPFKLSQFNQEWTRGSISGQLSNDVPLQRDINLNDFTSSLASKVCLDQAYSNILMPFSLMSYSMLSRSFFRDRFQSSSMIINNSPAKTELASIPITDIVKDFRDIEQLLLKTQPQFLAGWKSHLELLDEFKIDRDGIIRSSDNRKYVEFDQNGTTFHTMLYYSSQVMQMLLPIALCLLLETKIENSFDMYKNFRELLSTEFLCNAISLRTEYNDSCNAFRKCKVTKELRTMIMRHLIFYTHCHLSFLKVLQNERSVIMSNLLDQMLTDKDFFISKDMLRNMFTLVKGLNICKSSVITKTPTNELQSTSPRSSKIQNDELLELEDEKKLLELIENFQQVSTIAFRVMEQDLSK